jgi:hypothetical protein
VLKAFIALLLKIVFFRSFSFYGHVLLKIFLFGVGIFAFYVCLVLRKDQEGHLQNRIQELSDSIQELERRSGSRLEAFFGRIADAVSRAFDRVFGKRLLSIRMIGVSTSLAFSGACFAFVGLFGFLLSRAIGLPQSPELIKMGGALLLLSIVFLFVGFVFFVIALLPTILPYTVIDIITLIPILTFTYVTVQVVRHHAPAQTVQNQLELYAALIASTATDVILLIGIRQSIHWISEQVKPLRISLAILGQVGIVIFFVWLPEHVSGNLMIQYKWRIFPTFLLMTSGFNVFTAVAACAFVFTLLIVLLHRVFWPVVERFFYQITRYRLVRNHVAMATLGTACFIAVFPSLKGIMTGVLFWLISFFSGEKR